MKTKKRLSPGRLFYHNLSSLNNVSSRFSYWSSTKYLGPSVKAWAVKHQVRFHISIFTRFARSHGITHCRLYIYHLLTRHGYIHFFQPSPVKQNLIIISSQLLGCLLTFCVIFSWEKWIILKWIYWGKYLYRSLD